MDHTHEQRRCLDPGVKEKSPSTLSIKTPAKSLRKTRQLRVAGCPGHANGRTATGPMAFEKSTKLRARALCKEPYTHFKRMESYREDHAFEKRDRDDQIRYWRICAECETKLR
eukprot:8907157-Lingulodinium_polyedra.AAC.1